MRTFSTTDGGHTRSPAMLGHHWKGVKPGVFRPWDGVSRAQVVKMVARALVSLEPGRLARPTADFYGSLRHFDGFHAENMRVAEYNHLLDDLVGYEPRWDPWAKMSREEIVQVIWNGPEDGFGS